MCVVCLCCVIIYMCECAWRVFQNLLGCVCVCGCVMCNMCESVWYSVYEYEHVSMGRAGLEPREPGQDAHVSGRTCAMARGAPRRRPQPHRLARPACPAEACFHVLTACSFVLNKAKYLAQTGISHWPQPQLRTPSGPHQLPQALVGPPPTEEPPPSPAQGEAVP